MSDQDVYLIKNESGADKCPSGKLALYTNIDFHGGEMGDILIISPNIALTKQVLEGYGFIVVNMMVFLPLSIIWFRMPRWFPGYIWTESL